MLRLPHGCANGEDRDTGEYHGHGFTCLLDNMQAAFRREALGICQLIVVEKKLPYGTGGFV